MKSATSAREIDAKNCLFPDILAAPISPGVGPVRQSRRTHDDPIQRASLDQIFLSRVIRLDVAQQERQHDVPVDEAELSAASIDAEH